LAVPVQRVDFVATFENGTVETGSAQKSPGTHFSLDIAWNAYRAYRYVYKTKENQRLDGVSRAVQQAVRGRYGGTAAMKRTVTVQAFLEWAYAVERVSMSGGGGLLEAERRAAGVVVPGRSMTGALADQATLGVRVSGGGGLSCCHEDAELADRVVYRWLEPGERALVVSHAKMRSAPDWMPGARHRLEPRRKFNAGRTAQWRPEVVSYVEGRAGQVPAFCPVVERDAPETVARAREIYTRWRAALFVVHDALLTPGVTLSAHKLVSDFPPATPWTARR
jgi:hypothetical protein